MRKAVSVVVDLLPIGVWIGWFFLEFYEVMQNLWIAEVVLLLILPLLYSVYHVVFSKDKKRFVTSNIFFGGSQVVGYILSGLLYYRFISDDSETIAVVAFFSIASIVYISVMTLLFYGIRALMDRVKKHGM